MADHQDGHIEFKKSTTGTGGKLNPQSRVTRLFDPNAKVTPKGATGDKLPFEQQAIIDRIAGWEEGMRTKYAERQEKTNENNRTKDGEGLSRAAKKRKKKRGLPEQPEPSSEETPMAVLPGFGDPVDEEADFFKKVVSTKQRITVKKVKKRKTSTGSEPAKKKKATGKNSELHELEELNQLNTKNFLDSLRAAKVVATKQAKKAVEKAKVPDPRFAKERAAKVKRKAEKAKAEADEAEREVMVQALLIKQRKAAEAVTSIAADIKNQTKEKPQKRGPVMDLGEGLKYQDIRVGDGQEVTPGMRAKILYIGSLGKTGKRFDQRQNPNNPFEFSIGSGEVIAGMDAGVNGMKVGGARKVVIPPKYGYGMQLNKKIPPDSILVFDIKLVGV
jgi:FKBP-type peptidyl-prolyl cis-trans isomerase